jgi:hypothetical protein
MRLRVERRRTRLYLRHSVRRKNGKQHTYWRLARSVRAKVVQETVAQLGELDARGACQRPAASPADYRHRATTGAV